jgi:AraC-like DNA-binding protein
MPAAELPYFRAGNLWVLVRRGSSLPTHGGPNVGVLIQRAARERWREGSVVGPMVSQTHYFLYVLRGSLRLCTDDGALDALAGQLVATPPGARLSLDVPREALENVVINAVGPSLDSFWHYLGRREPVVLDVHRRTEVERNLDDLLEHALSDDAAERWPAVHYLEATLSVIACDQRVVRERSGRAAQHAERCHALIESSFLELGSARELADQLALNVDYLTRAYKARFGTTPAEHLRRRRLEQAMVWLERSDKPVAEIAELLGFSDAFAFSTAFKHYSGLAPRHWREQIGRI